MAQPIARVGDFHVCPKVTVKVPHVGGPIVVGSPNVFIGGVPAARVGDVAVCCAGGPDVVAVGATTVFINGMPAALMGSPTAHGGVVVVGAPNVVAS